MVRANPQYDQQADAGEWQDLRSELVALLDQVESQVNRAHQPDPAYHGLSERMRDLRHQVTEIEPETRHRDALRSVQRAVSRFSDRDELSSAGTNPRDTLESAIQQIRARHFPATASPAPLTREPPRAFESPRFEELAEAVNGIAGRLERLEAGLHTQAKGQTANVKEIAEQVSQLSQVVELLAGAVGETGQVKRLESQIAGLAKLIAREPQIDVSALTRRLDDVSQTVAKLAELQKAYADRSDTLGLTQRLDDVTATVGRLADLQVQLAEKADTSGLTKRLDEVTATVDKLAEVQARLANQADSSGITQRLDEVTSTVGRLADLQVLLVDKTDNTGLSRRLDDVTATVGRLADLQVQAANRAEAPQAGLKDAMKAIEDGVRAIYDRVDAIERQMAMPQAELEKITDELHRFAAAMKGPQQPQGLIELIDALNQRISDIELREPGAVQLRADVDAMRSAVLEAMEPRFAAIESQLEVITDKVANPPELNVSQLEAQVRQLVARMDQTGEQLTGLAKLYSQPAESTDFDALADKVAERTSAALADLGSSRAGLDETDYDEIEKRLGTLMQRVAAERPVDDNSALEATIREVNERLARLEQAVSRPELPLATPAAFPEPESAPAPEPEAAAEPVLADPEPVVADPAADPVSPVLADNEHSDEAPLVVDIEPEPEPEPLIARAPAAPEPGDLMPANPAEEAALYDRPFPDPNPLQRALEAKNGPRRRHSGTRAQIVAEELPPAPIPSLEFNEPEPVAYEPIIDDRPLPPLSSLDDPALAPIPERPAEPAIGGAVDRNTFIAAARRAAMRQSGTPANLAGPTSGNSLIARAFARFQATRAAEAATAVQAPPAASAEPAENVKKPKATKVEKAEKAKKERGFRIGRRQLAGDKEPSVAWSPDEPPPSVPANTDAVALGAEETSPVADDALAARPGVITRYRTVILGAITLLATVALVNLLVMRSQEAQDTPAEQPAASGDAAAITIAPGDPALSPTPIAQQLNLPKVPNPARVIPMTDTLATASIDPAAAQGFVAEQPMPDAVAATDPQHLATGVEPLASPVQVELPPEGIGPIELREAAANGDARAQFEVAAIYTEGRAVPEDLKAAAVWYERSASQGFAPAQYRLGNLYEAGKGVDKDLARARLWYQQAAEAGNRMAMHNLAALYASGGLGTQQFDAAAKWFEEAANRGMKDSQFNLGMLYARGLGVKQDLAASFRWFALAATGGDADAAKARDDIAKSLDAATVQRLNDEVAAWKPAQIDLAANFAPIGTWMKDFDPGTPISKIEVVKGVQRVLARLGYDVGTPDGLAGPKTAEAIKAFERGTGMNETGTVNPRLLAVLGSQPV